MHVNNNNGNVNTSTTTTTFTKRMVRRPNQLSHKIDSEILNVNDTFNTFFSGPWQ